MMIVFSGLDCSGKSTQIELLDKKYNILGHKTFIFWSRGGYTPGFQMLKDMLRFFAGQKLPKPGFSKKREKALSNNFIRKIWFYVAILDLIFYYAIYLRIKYYLGYKIICDRYLMDTKIDFNLTYPQENLNKIFLWKILNKIYLKPNFHFVSTIPVPESVIRSKFKFEPYPDSPQTLELRLKIYNKELKMNKNLIFIDGLKNKNDIELFISKLLKI